MRRFALVALTVAGVLLHAPTAQACTCATRSLPEQLEAATVVFTGTVRTVKSGARVAVALDVSAVYKGKGGRRLTVTTGPDSAACGIPFARGSSYVVFAAGDVEALSTGLCSGTTDDVTVVAGLSPLETFAAPGELPGNEPGSRSLPIGTAAGVLVLVLAAQIGAWLLRARPPRPLA